LDDAQARDRVARIEALLEEVEVLPGATELVEALLDLYGEGLARILGQLDDEQARGLADDELVAHLLVLHGLHPVPLDERVRGALAEVRPYLESHGGDVELLGVEDGVARLRLQGSCDGCPSSRVTLQSAIENAIHAAAPELEGIEADGAVEPEPKLLQLEVADSLRGWAVAGGLPELRGPVLKDVGGGTLLFVAVADSPYAYRPTCPACGESLAGAVLEGEQLTCACGARFDVRRAGRSLDGGDLHLEPVPLLVDEAGLMKVAVG
jgi:Fe-S cluster biogenesis protein NfuA